MRDLQAASIYNDYTDIFRFCYRPHMQKIVALIAISIDNSSEV